MAPHIVPFLLDDCSFLLICILQHLVVLLFAPLLARLASGLGSLVCSSVTGSDLRCLFVCIIAKNRVVQIGNSFAFLCRLLASLSVDPSLFEQAKQL